MQAIISGSVGGVAGMALGAVLAPFQSGAATLESENLPMRDQFRRGVKEMGVQSRSWGKNLAVIGAVFSCSECFVEKTRGRTDRWNPIVGGCITGGVLAVSGAQSPRPLPAAPRARARARSRPRTAPSRCRRPRAPRQDRSAAARPSAAVAHTHPRRPRPPSQPDRKRWRWDAEGLLHSPPRSIGWASASSTSRH